MYAGCSGRSVHGLARLGSQDLAGRGKELREHQGRRGWRGRLEMLARGRERPPEGPGEREDAEPRLERLQPAAVVLARDRARRQQRLGRAHYEPKGEQAVPLRSPHGVGHETDQARFRGGGGEHHATTRSTAATTSAAGMSARHRWWPTRQAAVPPPEQRPPPRVPPT